MLPSLVMVRKERDWPNMPLLPVNCHCIPQFLAQGYHCWLLPAFTNSCCTSPAPPTLVTRINRNQGLPLMVNRMPPAFKHETLQAIEQQHQYHHWQTLPTLNDTYLKTRCKLHSSVAQVKLQCLPGCKQ